MWQSSVLAYSFRLSCIRIFWIDSLFHSHTIQVFIFDTYFPAALSFILTMSREQNMGSVLQEHCKLSQIGDKYANSPRLSRAPARVVKCGRCLENARGESILFCNVPAHKAARCYTLCFGVVAKQVACSGFIRASDENSCLLLLEIRLMMLSASQKTQTMRLTVLKICRVSFFLVQTYFPGLSWDSVLCVFVHVCTYDKDGTQKRRSTPRGKKVIAAEWRADICPHLPGETLGPLFKRTRYSWANQNREQILFLSQLPNQPEGQQALIGQLPNHREYLFFLC